MGQAAAWSALPFQQCTFSGAEIWAGSQACSHACRHSLRQADCSAQLDLKVVWEEGRVMMGRAHVDSQPCRSPTHQSYLHALAPH